MTRYDARLLRKLTPRISNGEKGPPEKKDEGKVFEKKRWKIEGLELTSFGFR